jgi:four helix bundle protein
MSEEGKRKKEKGKRKKEKVKPPPDDQAPKPWPSIQDRTYQFALRIVKLCSAADSRGAKGPLLQQLIRSGTSIGANIEEAQGGQSRKDFVAKTQIAYKEARETLYWLRLLRDSGGVPEERMKDIVRECEEIVHILAAAIVSAKRIQ